VASRYSEQRWHSVSASASASSVSGIGIVGVDKGSFYSGRLPMAGVCRETCSA
jgi:hypothetical protein